MAYRGAQIPPVFCLYIFLVYYWPFLNDPIPLPCLPALGLFSLWSILLVEFSTELFIWIIELTSSFQVDFSSAITFLYWILFSYVRLISFLLSALLLFSWHLLMPSLSYLNIVIITLLNFLSKSSSDIFGYCRLMWIPCLGVLPSLSHGGSYYNISNIWRRRVLGFCVWCVCLHAGYRELGVSLLAEFFFKPMSLFLFLVKACAMLRSELCHRMTEVSSLAKRLAFSAVGSSESLLILSIAVTIQGNYQHIPSSSPTHHYLRYPWLWWEPAWPWLQYPSIPVVKC